jgi:predicted permease
MATLLQDLRFGMRMLTKNAGFTVVAAVTLALGIGANTAIFSIVNGVLLNPLPYHEPDRLVALYSRNASFDRYSISYPNFLDWVRENHSFSALAAYVQDDFNLTGKGEPERVRGERISASFFPLLGVKPVIGRSFSPEEDQVGAAPIVLISGGFWKRKFGSSPKILGTRLTLNGTGYSIVGVIPSHFYYNGNNFQTNSDVYIPIGQWSEPTFRDRKVSMGMDAVGRLKSGVTFEQAKADMDTLGRHLAEEYPEADNGTGITLVPLKANAVGDVQPHLLLLLGAVGFVLLIACVNVANLSLARSTGRTREFAIRIALGAGRRRVVRQLLTESVMLAIAGGGMGLLVAYWGLEVGLKLLPEALPRVQEVRLNGPVLFFTLASSILAGILFGLAPALKTSAPNVQGTLKEGGRGSSAGRNRIQSVFVVVEMVLAVVLLAGTGLMIRSLARLWSVDPGFDPHHVLAFRSSFPAIKSPDAMRAMMREMHDKLAAIPGLQTASLTLSAMPMRGDSEVPFWLEGQPKPPSDSQMKMTLFYLVQPDYLTVMRIPLERGRFLTLADNEHSPLVTVIDDRFAKLYFPGQNPVGRRVNFDILNTTAEIVGIVGHVKQWGLDESMGPPVLAQCYFPPSQVPDKFMPLLSSGIAAVVRAQGSPVPLVGPIRRTFERINSQAVIYDTETMDGIISDSLSTQRFSMILMAVFGGLALVMASIGIYGVISYVTSQRAHEIGIRMALGAQRGDILRMVVDQGLKLTLIGVGIGIIGALALMRFLTSLLYEVKPTDPLTFGAVSLILIDVAIASCYIPARRAAKLDPTVALRYE